MRTFVRFLAFLAVFACGLFLVVSGVILLTSAQPPLRGTPREILERLRAEQGPLPQPTPSAVPPQPAQQANASPPRRVKIQTRSSTELLNGDLFISVPQKSDFSRAVDVTIGSPGWPSKHITGMQVGDVAFYQGKCTVEVRLAASPDYEWTEFVVTERPYSAIDRATQKRAAASGTLDDFLETLTLAELDAAENALQAELDRREKAASARLSVIMGFVLMVSATLLIAVRPRVRRVELFPKVVARPALAGAAGSGPAKPQKPPQPRPLVQQASGVQGVARAAGQVAGRLRKTKHPLLIVGVILIGVGLIVTLVGIGQHDPYSHSSSRPGFRGHGFYTSSRSGGDTTAVIAAGGLILITGAVLAAVGYTRTRNTAPKP
ncbi:MAG: hypothetical protein WBC53_04605 [Phycisphaerae bacterium]